MTPGLSPTVRSVVAFRNRCDKERCLSTGGPNFSARGIVCGEKSLPRFGSQPIGTFDPSACWFVSWGRCTRFSQQKETNHDFELSAALAARPGPANRG